MSTPLQDDSVDAGTKQKKRARIGLFFVILAVGSLFLAFGTGKKQEPTTPAQAIEAAITDASNRPEKIEVTQRIDGRFGAVVRLASQDAWSNATYITSALGDIERILKGLAKAGQLPAMEEVGFFLNAKMKDKHGNESSDVLMKVYFKSSELQKINWGGINRYGLANLADKVVSYQSAKPVVIDFCTENFDSAFEFCKMASKN